MPQYQITSDNFKGEVFIAYNTNHVLNLIDLRGVSFGLAGVAKMVEAVPQTLGDDAKQTLLDLSRKYSFHIVLVPEDLKFDTFWDAFGHKENKQRCINIWKKLSDPDKLLAINRIKSYDRYLSWQDWRSRMSSAKWLKDRQFETEWHKLKR